MNEIFNGRAGRVLRYSITASFVCLTTFLLFLSVQTMMSLRYVGAGISAATTITVSGKGEAYAVPNIGEFSYSVVSDKATVALAQEDATQKSNSITAYLKQAAIYEKDIKTTDYSIAPQYEWRQVACISNVPCPVSGKQVIIGYEVRQTTDIKVRDTAKSYDLLTGVGSRGATEVSGISFAVEHPEAVQAEARSKAILDAKTRAEVLAQSLGVSLVRIVSFDENNNGAYPAPMYAMEKGVSISTMSAPVAPNISVGQNKIESRVSIVYEIR